MVGTVTEVSDFLRVLYARIGLGHCVKCGRAITAQTREQIIDRILALPVETRFLILAPVVRGQKGEFKDFFADMLKRGYVRARVDGRLVKLTDSLQLDKRIKHDIEIAIDRLKNEPRIRPRLAEAVEQALALAEGALIIAVEQPEGPPTKKEAEAIETEDTLLSAHYACTYCGISYEPPTPQLFGFNSPRACAPTAMGSAHATPLMSICLSPDPSISFFDGAFPIIGRLKGMGKWRKHIYEGVAATLEIDLRHRGKICPLNILLALLYGAGDKHITYEWKQRGGAVWKLTAAPGRIIRSY